MKSRITIRTARSPYQFALVGVCGLAGLSGLILRAPGPSTGISRAFGDGAPWFYVAMLGSALLVLAGMLWRRGTSARFRTGLEIERIGQWPLAGCCFAYAAALAASGLSALLAALLTGGIGVAALVRVRIITVDLGHVEELIALDAKRGQSP